MKIGKKTQYFSEITGKFYQLLPTATVPALRINAVPMHRFAKIDPLANAKRIVAAAKARGAVLDICTGLGYTAIEAAKMKDVTSVTTVEQDLEVMALCRLNEASARLFTDGKICRVGGNACQKILELPEKSFDAAIHDPPTLVAAPELYRVGFYKEIHRVLKNGGTLWHYAAMPGKASGRKSGLPQSIILNLGKAGFSEARLDEHSAGITCIKK